jgi:pimeloyl-ACP methyl ester carboxylesterase
VVARLRDAAPGLRVATFAGAGHIPHVTHASAYVDAITAFVHEHAAGRERGPE